AQASVKALSEMQEPASQEMDKTELGVSYTQKLFEFAKDRVLSFLDGEKGLNDLKPMGRVGHDEISHVLKAFPDSIPIVPEAGALGEPTPQQVYQEQTGLSPLEQYQKEIPSLEKQIEREMDR
ncbi:MAG: hypothetical protein AAFX06_24250, partial [Planctomycetota bacterium]